MGKILNSLLGLGLVCSVGCSTYATGLRCVDNVTGNEKVAVCVPESSGRSIASIYTFRYDNKGDLIDMLYDFDGDGNNDYSEGNGYDEKRNQIITGVNSDNSGNVESGIERKFDGNGDLVEEKVFKNSKCVYGRTLFYYVKGDLMREEIDYDCDGKIDRILPAEEYRSAPNLAPQERTQKQTPTSSTPTAKPKSSPTSTPSTSGY